MTGTVVTHKTQVGQSGTAANNFTIRTLDDGILRVSRGNAGAELSDPLKIEANGNVSLLPTASLNGKNQCTAWVNFNGTDTVAIRDSHNVSSVTDNGVGLYTINFATSMANANYAFALGSDNSGDNLPNLKAISTNPPTASALPIRATDNGNTARDFSIISAIIFGGK